MSSVYGTIAGIDVHKKWLYIVVGGEEKRRFRRHRCGSTTVELEELGAWLAAEQVRTVVMESTAQYWRPVWLALEGRFELLLAQAQSNAARRGRKSDYADAERLVRRLHAEELVLSFVPDAEQREWRLLARTRVEYARDVVRSQNRIESLLEEARIKISGWISNLLGVSGRRMLEALAAGESDPRKLAALGDGRLRATPEQLAAALNGSMSEMQRLLLRQRLDEIALLERNIEALDQAIARSLTPHREAIERLCAIPGIGVTAAEQIIAELGPEAATFPTAGHAASWVGVCPGRQESAGVSQSDRSPKGNRPMRRIITQCAWAAVRTKGCFFAGLFRRLVPRLGIQKAVWAVAHRLLRIVWMALHNKLDYQEFGPAARDPQAVAKRLEKMVREIKKLGFRVEITPA